MKQFEVNVTTIMKYLETESFCSSVISTHRLCYAICQEVYHRGELVSPTSLMMFDNMEELGGVTRRQGTFALELQTSGQDLAGSALVIQHDGTTATFNRLLAVDFPECDALAWCWREGKTELPDDGSVIIGAVYYRSAGPD